MKVIRTLEELDRFGNENKQIGNIVGFVPTMGFLHQGHISLINCAKSTSDIVIASIYVNPSQFNNLKDFQNYPKNEINDLKLLSESCCDAVFIPLQKDIESVREISIELGYLDEILEGRFRPGHFKGVVEVVSRLFSVVNPDKAYFGEKDFQQLQVIKKVVKDSQFSIEIIGVPILREANGLAMSSRNSKLSFEGRKKAGFIYDMLKSFTEPRRSSIEKKLCDMGFDLEYLEKHHLGEQHRLFIAGVYEGVRLIDNIQIS